MAHDEEREDQERDHDEWTGSFKRPWLNPPMRHSVGAGQGSWRYGMAVIGLAVLAAIVVLVLVNQDVLARGWAYAVIPVALVAAAAARVLTILKAGAESRNNSSPE